VPGEDQWKDKTVSWLLGNVVSSMGLCRSGVGANFSDRMKKKGRRSTWFISGLSKSRPAERCDVLSLPSLLHQSSMRDKDLPSATRKAPTFSKQFLSRDLWPWVSQAPMSDSHTVSCKPCKKKKCKVSPTASPRQFLK
jgi:hypothetical protein